MPGEDDTANNFIKDVALEGVLVLEGIRDDGVLVETAGFFGLVVSRFDSCCLSLQFEQRGRGPPAKP